MNASLRCSQREKTIAPSKTPWFFFYFFFFFEVCLFLFCVSTDLSTFNFQEAKPFGMMHEVPCISVVQWCFKWDGRSYNKKDIRTLIDIDQVPEHDVVPGLDFFFFWSLWLPVSSSITSFPCGNRFGGLFTKLSPTAVDIWDSRAASVWRLHKPQLKVSESSSLAGIKIAANKEGGKGTNEHLFSKNQDVKNRINQTTKGCKLLF